MCFPYGLMDTRQEKGRGIGTGRRAAAILLMVILGATGTAAQAALYVYQMPDGSRIATDHALSNKHYKLIRAGRNTSGVGILLAARTPQFFRTNPRAYDRLIAHSAARQKVNKALVKAIIHAESGFNPYATSDKGACGLMQLMPGTAEKYGVSNLYDPEQNIRAGVRHLKYLLRRFRNNTRLAVAAYNAGEKAVRRYRGIPPYTETRRYVTRVLRYKRRYASMARDSGA
jgi:soluble lytic murein transglycosylase-like protein